MRVLSFGGLLGQFDGFCKHPATEADSNLRAKPEFEPCLPLGPASGPTAAADWPAAMGGLLGVRRTLADLGWPSLSDSKGDRPSGTLLVLQADNQLPDFADVVGTPPPFRAAAPGPQRRPDAGTQMSFAEAFWANVAALRPHAVALGQEDFHRGLRLSSALKEALVDDPANTPARRYVRWIRASRVPFLASNVVVRTTQDRLNVLNDGRRPLRLVLDRDTSTEWLKELKIEHPCGREAFELADGSRSIALAKVEDSSPGPRECTGAGLQTSTFTVADGVLRPGSRFEVREKGQEPFARFETTSALKAVGTMSLGGWPAVLADPAGAVPGESADRPVVVVSLVSPSFKKGLGASAWQWTLSAQTSVPTAVEGGDPCLRGYVRPGEPEAQCTIDVLPPADTLTAILTRLRVARALVDGAKATPPFVVLVAALTDDEILSLLDKFQEIRAVILPPESALLGRGLAPSTKGMAPKVSGDLGAVAVVDGGRSDMGRVLVRPEWVAETVATVVATPPPAGSGDGWRLDPAGATVIPVLGRRLRMQVDETPSTVSVRYWPDGLPEPFDAEAPAPTFPAYLPCRDGETGPRCRAFRLFWTNHTAFLAVAGDAIRARTHADVAVVPHTLADADALAWLAEGLGSGSTAWLSRFILHRAAFRSYRVVRADVSGEQLLGVLLKILDESTNTGEPYCLSGLGGSTDCPASLKGATVGQLRVNGRVVHPTSYYTLALPDAVAETLSLAHDHDEEDGYDALDALDRHLAGDGHAWDPGMAKGNSGTESDDDVEKRLIAGLESRRIGRRYFLKVSDAEAGVTNFDVDGPNQSNSVPGSVDVDFRNAQSYSSLAAAARLDTGWDGKRFALRAVGEVEYTRRALPDSDIKSYERNRVLGGVRADIWKFRHAGDLRPFVGYFREGPIVPAVFELKPSRTTTSRVENGATITTTETSGAAVRYTIDRNLYDYWSVGLDMYSGKTLSDWSWWKGLPGLGRADLSLSRAKVQGDSGLARRVPLELESGDWTLGRLREACDTPGNAALRNGDTSGFLSALFACQPDVVTGVGRELHLVTEERRQRRLQVDLEGAVSFKAHNRTFKLSMRWLGRLYEVTGGQMDLAVRQTQRTTIQMTVPLWWRLELAPTYERQSAHIFAGADNAYRVHRWDVRVKFPVFALFGRHGFVE